MRATLLAASALSLVGPAIIMMAAPSEAAIQALRDKMVGLQEESETILAKADEESRELSDDELAKIDANAVEVEKLDKQIKARERVAIVAKGGGRRTTEPTDPSNRVPATPRVIDARGGFRSLGEFAVAVRQASLQGAQPDQRLLNAATTFGTEGVGTDGGFVVPPDFSKEIMVKVYAEENLLVRATPFTPSGNSMTFPKDETTPWDTTSGVQVFWEGEAATHAQSKPALKLDTVRLVKLSALVPISDELLEDASGLESWLRAKAPAKMVSKINAAIIRGTGVGQPLGFLNSPSLVSVAEEAGQSSSTIWFQNVNKMWSRMYAPWHRNAVWLINQDGEPQLNGMAFDPAATSKVPVYLGPNGIAGSPYATLYGRPVIPLEACSALGTQGDIFLVDMAQYWAFTKAGGIRTDTSIHLYFDQSLTAFRFIFRMNGMPAWSTTLTRENGSNALSWCVTLDNRP